MSQLYRRKIVLWMKLRSRRGKFIYNRTYNSVGLNQVSHFSRRGRSPSSKIRRITSVNDMIQIMTVGNQLYSSLLFLARQSMLMLTELLEMCTTCLSDFSSLNTVNVILVTCMVMTELKGITTVCHLKHSWL